MLAKTRHRVRLWELSGRTTDGQLPAWPLFIHLYTRLCSAYTCIKNIDLAMARSIFFMSIKKLYRYMLT